MSNNDTTTTPANPTTPAMTETLDYAVRNGVTINPPADFPYREAFMEHFGHRLRPSYPLTPWELYLWQALWLMPKEQLLATDATMKLKELHGDEWLYVVHGQDCGNILTKELDAALDNEELSGFMAEAGLIARVYRPGDVTPEGTAVTQPEEVMA